ncbi:hypothetical protein TSMEX_009708 [Taenia solium]|eukprot:TsM_000853800 transcript=TsM_000853800 gene=TsM_000853800
MHSRMQAGMIARTIPPRRRNHVQFSTTRRILVKILWRLIIGLCSVRLLFCGILPKRQVSRFVSFYFCPSDFPSTNVVYGEVFMFCVF